MIMERPARDFKGVWIPREIWLSPTLSLMEKVLFVEIHSLDNERGCYASNRHFAAFFGVSERQIRTNTTRCDPSVLNPGIVKLGGSSGRAGQSRRFPKV